jgi:hypothetical protein
VDEAVGEDEVGVELDDQQANADVEDFSLGVDAHQEQRGQRVDGERE